MPFTVNRSYAVLALSIFASLLGSGIIVPLLPLYAEDMGATGLWLGIIFSGFSISRTIVMPFVGRLSDRWGRRLFLAIGLFTYSLISLGYIGAGDVLSLALLRFVHGISAGMIIPIAQAYVADISPPGEEGRWMGYFNAAFFAGFASGPLMGGFLTDYFGFALAFGAMAGLNFLAFLGVVFFLPESTRQRALTGSPVVKASVFTSRRIRGLFSYRLTFSVGRAVFSTFMPVFAGINLGLSPSQIGVLVSANMMLMSFLQIYGGHLADKYSRRALVVQGALVNVAFFALIPLAANFWQLLALCILGGIGGSLSMPSATAMVVEEGKRFGMGVALAAFAMAFSIGMAVGPVLAGIVADLVTVNLAFYFGAGVGLLGIGLFVWYSR